MRPYLTKFNQNIFFRAVCIGDASTAQDWCHPNWIDWLNYTVRQDENWRCDWRKKVINNGRDGGTLDHYLEYFDEEVTFFEPDVVIISLGLNCLIPVFNPNDTGNRLSQLLQKISNLDCDVITWSPYALPDGKFFDQLAEINSIYRYFTERFDGVYVDMFSEFHKYDLSRIFTFVLNYENPIWDLHKGDIDYLHCNEIGNQIIAQKILSEAFRKNLNDWNFASMHAADLSEYLL